MYHGIAKETLNPPYDTFISIKEFMWQMDYISKHYNVLPLRVVIENIKRNEKLPNNVAIVTFDDGFLNNYTIAYPVLKERKIPATIFVATGNIYSGEIPWPEKLFLIFKNTRESKLDMREYGLGVYDLRSMSSKMLAWESVMGNIKRIAAGEKKRLLLVMQREMGMFNRDDDYNANFSVLSWRDIKEMHADGLVDFGAHTVGHEILTSLDTATMEKEIVGSCETIQKELGVDKISFAYPNGSFIDFNDLAKEILRKQNVQCALTAMRGLNTLEGDVYEFKRISGCEKAEDKFKLVTSGFLEVVRGIVPRSDSM